MILAKTLELASGETVKVSQPWTAHTEKRETTVSASTWTYSGAGSLASAALATPVASVFLTATGSGTLTNTVTLANGEVFIAERRVEVS